MPSAPIIFPKTLSFRASPINPQWIISGTPEARCAVLATSADGLATSIVWECTPGSFNWHYDFDETVHFIEGSVTICDSDGQTQRLGAGDIVVFPAGSHAIWTVHSRIRKVAVCKRALPRQLGTVISFLRSLKHMLRGRQGEAAAVHALI